MRDNDRLPARMEFYPSVTPDALRSAEIRPAPISNETQMHVRGGSKLISVRYD
jgi:hypothetical protein